jgi:rhodanese-related sulfurtransferase
MAIGNVTAKELQARLQGPNPPLLVDVREPWEAQTARIEGARLIPLQTLPDQLATLPKDREVVFQCHHGMRSLRACQLAESQGFQVSNLQGGIAAWSSDVDPKVPQY